MTARAGEGQIGWRLLHYGLTLILLALAGLTLRSAAAIGSNPDLRPLRDATTAEIAASLDRQLARASTPDHLAARIDLRLTKDPRNWVALDALVDLAAERGISLPPGLVTRLADARARDFSATTLAAGCLACAVDITTCTLTTAMMCKLPVLLTPLEDMRGIAQAGADYATGEAIDRIDLGLSVLGLSATGLALVSGGSSLTVKGGVGVLKLARGMNRLSPRLADTAAISLREGIDWAALPAARSADDLAALMRPEALAPLAETAADLGRMADTLGPTATLHLLPLIDDATDAARLSRVSQAHGPRTVAAADLLGPSRLLRATVRITDLAAGLVLGLTGLLVSAGALVGNALQSVLWRRLLRASR
jgi:hypothetical protein